MSRTNAEIAQDIADDLEQPDAGYICKRCGEASPMAVGYAATYPGARFASRRVVECQCGHSRCPIYHPRPRG